MSHDKDVHQIKSAKKRGRGTDHSTKNGILDQKLQEISQKDHSDMDEKARQAEEQLTAASAADVLARLDDDNHKDKKSKKERRKSGSRSRPGEPDNDAEEVFTDNGADEEKKRRQAVLVTDSIDSPPKPKSGKKKKDKDATDPEVPSSVPEDRDGKTKKSNKRKHANCNLDEAPASVDTVNQDQQPPKKKLKIINPKKDELLSEQALKALAYAYSQYRHPEKWKFSKARQNWITRNVWSADTIPDHHLPLVTWYLKGVKGGVRDALIEKCQSHAKLPSQCQSESKPTAIESVPVPPVSTSAPLFGLTPEALEKPSKNAVETKRLRAQILLEALQAP